MKTLQHPVLVFVLGVIVGTYFGAKIKSGVSTATSKLA